MQNIENFLEDYRREHLLPPGTSENPIGYRSHRSHEGTYSTELVPFNVSDEALVFKGSVERLIKRLAEKHAVEARPTFGLPPLFEEESGFKPKQQIALTGIEFRLGRQGILGATLEENFDFYFLSAPSVKTREMPAYYSGMPYVGADHHLGSTVAHIRVNTDDRNAQFYYHGRKFAEFFVEPTNPKSTAEFVIHSRVPFSKKVMGEGALTHFLQMLHMQESK